MLESSIPETQDVNTPGAVRRQVLSQMSAESVGDLPTHEADIRASLTFGNPLSLSSLSLLLLWIKAIFSIKFQCMKTFKDSPL